ncbi:MAG: zinc dependent phospholipase C family protein [Coriobacteriales bacterium]|jgi:hypothetical protein|nr:zinc dependent phospholipase C family protein [Coriobacteriales bacterium]
MPAAIAHHIFGEHILESFGYQRYTSFDEHNAFMLGNQGPDPLYYLITGRKLSEMHLLGTRMHRESVNTELEAMRSFSNSLGEHERSLAQAYFHGFLCHFFLDSRTHPLINAQVRALTSAGVPGLDGSSSSEVHGQIEADLDAMMLWRRKGVDIRDYRDHQKMLWASDELLETVDKIIRYVAISAYRTTLKPGTFSRAIRDMRFVRRAMWSPRGIKRSLFGTLERLTRPHSLVQAMSTRVDVHDDCAFSNSEHLPWNNPSTHETSTESFDDLFDAALDEAVGAIGLAEDNAAFEEITRGLNFMGIRTKKI